ncbi:EamA family transporter [Agromyces sp. SYSU T00194]|uniref:EamA family transporter n=1 Tax=Agromyces chitinivorans TaxID=3158560 RepID=UPI00339B084C
MLTVVIGLAGALVYGAADFLGGLAARRVSALLATAVAASSGLVALLVAYPFVGGEWHREDVLLGALSGVAGAIALTLLYACLAVGPMSILSPLTAVVSAIVPMAWGLAAGEALASIGYVALGLALVAVVLVGFVPEQGAVRPSVRGIAMAIGAGTAIGAFLIIIDGTSDASGIVPLVLNRSVSVAVMTTALAVLVLVARSRSRAWSRRAADAAGARASDDEPIAAEAAHAAGAAGVAVHAAAREDDAGPRDAAGAAPRTFTLRTPGMARGIRFALACGVVDVAANVLLLVGLRIGDLTVVSVLTAMYPAGTILLAAIVLRERIAPVQWVGLALAITAAAMLAAA